jgi:hypothetical protein
MPPLLNQSRRVIEILPGKELPAWLVKFRG